MIDLSKVQNAALLILQNALCKIFLMVLMSIWALVSP